MEKKKSSIDSTTSSSSNNPITKHIVTNKLSNQIKVHHNTRPGLIKEPHSSLNSLDSFRESPIVNQQQSKLSNVVDAVMTDDLLIPNSLDEEEIMLRKALELSLKETKMTNNTNILSSGRKVVNKLDAIDDFSDDNLQLTNQNNISNTFNNNNKNNQMINKNNKSQPNTNRTNNNFMNHKPQPQSQPNKSTAIKSPFNKLSQQQKPNNSMTTITSFAAVAAGSAKPTSYPKNLVNNVQKQPPKAPVIVPQSKLSSTINSTPVAASKALMFLPSRPIILPFNSSLSILKTETAFSIACSAAVL